MATVINETFPKAQKDHYCDACHFVLEDLPDLLRHLPYSSAKEIVKAKRNGYKIIKGQQYINQFNRCDGEVYTFKAIPEIHDICLDYDLYPVC